MVVEGKLVEMDCEPCNVQVETQKFEVWRGMVHLSDSQGTIVEVHYSPARKGRTKLDEWGVISSYLENQEGVGSDSSVNEDTAADFTNVRAQSRLLEALNNELRAQMSALEAEVSMLTNKLKRKAQKVSEV